MPVTAVGYADSGAAFGGAPGSLITLVLVSRSPSSLVGVYFLAVGRNYIDLVSADMVVAFATRDPIFLSVFDIDVITSAPAFDYIFASVPPYVVSAQTAVDVVVTRLSPGTSP
jgi:hypothetical protein